MAFAIGYNVSKANELMNEIAKAYENLGIYTEKEWDNVIRVLQANWVGEDEQDFEKKLADRICNLYENASNLARGCVDTIGRLAGAWYDFQSKNTLDGGTVGSARLNIEVPQIIEKKDIVSVDANRTIDDNADRGLRDKSSKTAIQEAVNTFVSQIKERTARLFEEIDTNKAFLGEQSSNIKSYVEKVGSSIAEVTIAVRDMYQALETLADSSYTNSLSSLKDEFTKASTDVESQLDDLGSSRWS